MRPTLRGAAALSLGFALACADGDDDDTRPEPPLPVLPTIDGPEPAFARVRPGETAAFEWTVTWPDGEMPDTQMFSMSSLPSLDGDAPVRGGWVDAERTRYRIEVVTEEPGRYEARPVPTVVLPRGWGQVAIEAPPYAPLLAVGGPADVVIPPVASTSLAVGEVRPFFAYPATAPRWVDQAVLRAWSDDPLAWSVDDPGVATVSADGVITGVAPGTTTLRIAAGPAEAAVSVTVTDAALGPPGAGAWHVADLDAYGYDVYEPEPNESKATIDDRGWPMIALPYDVGHGPAAETYAGGEFDTDHRPLVLTRWTGTGFGFEPLGAPWERSTSAAVAVSGDGYTWMLVRDSLFNTVEVWDRAGDGPGGWSTEALPVGVDLGLGELEVSWGPRSMHELEAEQGPFYALAGADDDAFFAYAVFQEGYDYPRALETEQCPRLLRVVHAGPTGIEVELVERTWTLTGFNELGCNDTRPAYERLIALPPDFGSPFPALVAKTGLFGDTWAWRWTPDGWVGEHPPELTSTGIAAVLPVEDGSDWFLWPWGEGDFLNPGWAWQDAEGTVYTAAPDPVDGEVYVGHAADATHVYAFFDDGLSGSRLEMRGWAR